MERIGSHSNYITFEGGIPDLTEVCRMASERCGLEVKMAEGILGKENEIVFYCDEIWQALRIRVNTKASRLEFRWRTWFKRREFLRLVLVKCFLDMGGSSKEEESFFSKKQYRDIALSPYPKVKKLLLARLTGKFSLQMDARYWKLDEQLQRV